MATFTHAIGRLFRTTKKVTPRELELQKQSIARHDLGNELVARVMELEEHKIRVDLLARKLEVKLSQKRERNGTGE
jgi:hypothetical protein